METTAAIPTKFSTTIKTIKWLRGWFQYAPDKSEIADGRHFEKPLNRDMSATV